MNGIKMTNLEMSTFKFVNCNGSSGNYPCNGLSYNEVTVGGLKGLLNALAELKPQAIYRLS